MNEPRDATVFVGARVRCMDDEGTHAEAIAYRDGRIVAVGDRVEVLRRAGTDPTIEDLGGALVLPGFVDAHHHVSLSALWGGQVRLAAPAVTDIASLQAALATEAEKTPPGRWMVATEWDEGQLAERRPPTRAELDEAVGDHPLFAIHYTCHRAVANSRALELAGVDRHTSDPSGGKISRGRNGIPDGLLIERAMSRVEALCRSDLVDRDTEGFLERLAAHYRALVSVGITRVADTAVPVDLLPLYREAVGRGEVLVPTLVCPSSSTGYLEEPWDVLEGARTGEEFGPVTVGPAKLVFDGAPGCAMCLGWWQFAGVSVRTGLLALQLGSADPVRTALSVSPRLGGKIRSGINIFQPDEANEVVDALVANGFAVATHAIGNDAIDIAIGAYAARGSALHSAGLARVEHAAFVERRQAEQLADLGVAVTAQPAMLAMPSYASAPTIPGLPFFPLRRLLDAGVLVAGSSDYPVTGFDPLDGVRSAVSRITDAGRVRSPAERITVDEALAMYTRGAAEACGCLDETGTLEVGKRADLVVLDGELTDLDSLRVRRTIVGGLSHHD